MQFFICRLDPKTQNTQKHKENQDIHKGVGRRRRPTPLWRRPEAASLIFLVFRCFGGFGAESTYQKLRIISGKHAQELYVYFDMLPEASDQMVGDLDGRTVRWTNGQSHERSYLRYLRKSIMEG